MSLVVLTGCGSYRVSQFNSFAETGSRYSQAIAELTEEVGLVAIDADSEILLKDRELFTPDERREIYRQRTEALQELLENLRHLRQHSLLLHRYFVILAKMTGGETANLLAREQTELAVALRQLAAQMGEGVIGEAAIVDLMEQSRPARVTWFRQRRLNRQLATSAPVIERELALQKEMLESLALELKADLQVVAEVKSYQEVELPYFSPNRIPANWQRRRREVLGFDTGLAAADHAAELAEQMHTSFRQLAEGRLEPEGWSPLLAEINLLFDLIETVRKIAGNDG